MGGSSPVDRPVVGRHRRLPRRVRVAYVAGDRSSPHVRAVRRRHDLYALRPEPGARPRVGLEPGRRSCRGNHEPGLDPLDGGAGPVTPARPVAVASRHGLELAAGPGHRGERGAPDRAAGTEALAGTSHRERRRRHLLPLHLLVAARHGGGATRLPVGDRSPPGSARPISWSVRDPAVVTCAVGLDGAHPARRSGPGRPGGRRRDGDGVGRAATFRARSPRGQRGRHGGCDHRVSHRVLRGPVAEHLLPQGDRRRPGRQGRPRPLLPATRCAGEPRPVSGVRPRCAPRDGATP